jgi:4-hydroxy-tetrahydrodipicolinate synthase
VIHKKDAKDWAHQHGKGLWTNPTFCFDESLRLDDEGSRRNIEYCVQVQADAIGFGFSEPWVCSLAERMHAMEVAIDAIRRRTISFVYVTDHSVEGTIAMAKCAEAIGADAVMIWAPYEWAKSQDMACEFYEYVGSRLDIAIIAYNTHHSGIKLTPESVARIATIPNVCLIKETFSVSHIARVEALCGDQIVISDNHEFNLLSRTLASQQPLMLGTTSVFLMQSPHYQPIREYWQLAKQGKAAEATQKYRDLEPLREIWKGMYKTREPVACIKYWMDLNGMAGGAMRPPMKSLSAEEKHDLKTRLEASGWLPRLFPALYARADRSSL